MNIETNNTDNYSVLYKINIGLVLNKTEIINVASSDIVSVMMLNNYDRATYPIIRVRLYSDISLMQKLVEYPNDISIRCNMDGGIYRMNDDINKSPTICKSTKSISFQLKVYLENKNTPTSTSDSYEDGLKKTTDLNSDIKVPIELYCYDEYTVRMMRQRAPSIYKNTSILSVAKNLFDRNSLYNYTFDEFANQEKYDQILIPNMPIIQALSFIDIKYGIYKKGAQLYCDTDNIYICDSDVNNQNKPYPIYVMSSKTNSDMSGVTKHDNQYYMTTLAGYVSVISETDVERVLNSEDMSAININDLSLKTETMDKLYSTAQSGYSKKSFDTKIVTPNILHKSLNQGLLDTYIARINEKITKIDVSGVGFDIQKMKINARYNLIFESPIRGMSMNDYYRASNICHVLTNLDSDLFIAQTTMNLCNN